MKENFRSLTSGEWQGIIFFSEGLLIIVISLFPENFKEKIVSIVLSGAWGFCVFLAFSVLFIAVVAYIVSGLKSKKI